MWKSDNQGFKEDTFIQTGRRGGVAEGQRDGLAQNNGGSSSRSGMDSGDNFGASDPSPRLHSPGFQHWEDRFPLPQAVKTSGIGAVEETARFLSPKGPAQS